MINIQIRNYESKDWAQIQEIHDTARKIELRFAGLEDAFVPLQQAAVKEGLFDYNVCVALIDNNVVGFGAYSEDEIAWLYVNQERTRQGIGRSLVIHMLNSISKRPIGLEVLEGNKPALDLYQSMGFEVVETCSGVMPGNETFSVKVHCMQMLS